MVAPRLPRNDPRQYDDLVDEWWSEGSGFAVLRWLAAARAEQIPAAAEPGAVLVDVACGGGVLAPYVSGLGYLHIGVDLGMAGLRVAREHGVVPVCGDARRLPLRDGSAQVVVAGEVLEHVPDLPAVVAELARVLAPGGVLVLDTLADTWLARFVTVTLGERLRFVPVGLHDPRLYVNRRRLVDLAARHGIALRLVGLRPKLGQAVRWVLRRRGTVRMVPTRSTALLFQGVGRKSQSGV